MRVYNYICSRYCIAAMSSVLQGKINYDCMLDYFGQIGSVYLELACTRKKKK